MGMKILASFDQDVSAICGKRLDQFRSAAPDIDYPSHFQQITSSLTECYLSGQPLPRDHSQGPPFCIILLTVQTSRSPSAPTWALFLAWLGLCCFVFLKPLLALFHYAWNNDNSSHILLIPFIVAWLLYVEKTKDTSTPMDLFAALWFALPAGVLAALGLSHWISEVTLVLAILILAFVLLVIGGFACFFGRKAAVAAYFPLAFLLFLVPLPAALLNRLIYWLQVGSAEVAAIMFDCTGLPVLREGFAFHLPKMTIEVAQECSGIRSSMALIILALLVSHFAFSRFWKKAVFVAAGLLMMVVKNGIRIATLTILANYVDPDFLSGRLHHQGGIVFFLIGLALLWPVYRGLRHGEPSFESQMRSQPH